MSKSAGAKKSYSASDIEVLEGLEPVRKRPGMYIGGTDSEAGLLQLVKEIVDNSVDEAMNGHANCITVTLHKDRKSVSVEDNGRGIPVDIHPKFKKSALELILTTLHAGGKFSDQNYKSSGGLHGVGASVVNALSEELVAYVQRDGFEWSQVFSRGKAKGGVKKGKASKLHSTRIFFRPDAEIFSETVYTPSKIANLLQEKAFLNSGLKIEFINESDGSKVQYLYQDGMRSFLDHLLQKNKLNAITSEVFQIKREDLIRIELAITWVDARDTKFFSYVNGIYTPLGGTHEDGFRSGLGKAIRNYISVHNLLPKGLKLIADDLREGLVGVLSVNVPASFAQLQFQGQTKDKLNNAEVAPPVDSLTRTFEDWLNSKPSIAGEIVERILRSARSRLAAKEAIDIVSRKSSVNKRLNLPGKLADCSSNKAENSELFIVEGDSAGGSAKQGRNRDSQAIFPLRGKVLNSISSGAKVSENQELKDLIAVLGCGSGAQFDLKKLRYGKVVILTDADSDGMHISSLLLAFFYKNLRGLIDAGRLYVAMPPLFKVKLGAGSSEEVHWCFDDRERNQVLAGAKKRKVQISRFKGLGEMNPSTLWQTTLNPKTRNLLKIKVVNEKESEATLNALFGRDVAPRFKLIQENALRLELDV